MYKDGKWAFVPAHDAVTAPPDVDLSILKRTDESKGYPIGQVITPSENHAGVSNSEPRDQITPTFRITAATTMMEEGDRATIMIPRRSSLFPKKQNPE